MFIIKYIDNWYKNIKHKVFTTFEIFAFDNDFKINVI